MESIDIGRMDLSDLKTDVDLYRNLFYHRTVILEGIRKIAAKNMMHLIRATEACQSSHTHQDDDWLACVQQRMLKDQGLEDNRWNRTLLGIATFAPLKVYLALLDAEFEYYQKACRLSDTLCDDALSVYIDNNNEWAARLHDFRDPFLHPNLSRGTSELSFLSYQGSYNRAPEAQHQIDAYLMRLKQKLFGLGVEKLLCLSEHQRLICTVLFRLMNLERMELHHDTVGCAHVADLLESLCREQQQSLEQITKEVTSWSPSRSQGRAMRILSECLNQVCPSGPEQQFSIDEDAIQTPMLEIGMLSLIGSGELESNCDGRAAEHARQNIEYYRELLMTVDVLWNEIMLNEWQHQPERSATQEDLATFVKTRSQRTIAASIGYTPENIGLQRADEAVAPTRVSTAILYEPLRMYAQIVRDNPQVLNSNLKEWIDTARLRNLKIYRNSVFHVTDHARKVDLSIVENNFNLSKLYGGLSQFFGMTLKT